MADGTWQTKPNSGSVFNNKRKERETHSDLNGECLIEVQCPHCQKQFEAPFWVNIWRKVGRDKLEWLSLGFRKKEPRANGSPTPRQSERDGSGAPKSTAETIGDDIPF